MDVHLLVYDLSQGLARQMSMGLLGFQLDAVYHTSILLNGREYVYDGGVVDITPGSSHLGRPLQQLPLGKTQLPMDVILEYLQTLRQIYTLEAYNLWHHNCNNFSNDFSTFLVGTGIPDHILHMPDAVINSPLGAMLMPALNQQVAARRQGGGILGLEAEARGGQNGVQSQAQSLAQPNHPHQKLKLPTFSKPQPKPVLYTKAPPIPKLVAKMGPAANDSAIKGVIAFLETRSKEGPAEAPLPDIAHFTEYLRTSFQNLPPEVMFTVLDLLRTSLIDPRFSGFLAEEASHPTLISLLTFVNSLPDCPYSLRLVTLQMACNLFSSPLYPAQILEYEPLRSLVIHLISSSFLDDSHNSVRVAAASLLFNVAVANSAKRREGADALPEGDQVELAASALEAISQEEKSPEALEGMLLALGYLCYCMPLDGELADTMRAMDAADTIGAKAKAFGGLGLVKEVGEVLLGQGLKNQ